MFGGDVVKPVKGFPRLSAVLDELGASAWSTFVAEFEHFMAATEPTKVASRVCVVAMVKDWIGDPLAAAWEAAALDVDASTEFATIVAGFDR